MTKEIGKEDISLLIEDDAQEEDENSQFGTYIRNFAVQYVTAIEIFFLFGSFSCL